MNRDLRTPQTAKVALVGRLLIVLVDDRRRRGIPYLQGEVRLIGATA